MEKLIYIVGSGRSGSTVIERILNTAPNLVSVGEIHALWRLPLTDLLCSCGKNVQVCDFWGTALDKAEIGAPELARLKELEHSFIRNKFLARNGFNLERLRKQPGIIEFNALQTRLFDGIRFSAKADIVLDSSKAGPRAWALAAGFDPVFLHTYRSAKDVIASWRRPKFEPSTQKPMPKPSVLAAGLSWVKVEQSARSLRRIAQVRSVDYPSFSKAPKATLATALDPVLPGLVDSVNWTSDNAVLPSGEYHSVLGNPDRFETKEIVVQHRSVDRSTFPPFERKAIEVVGAALEVAYKQTSS